MSKDLPQPIDAGDAASDARETASRNGAATPPSGDAGFWRPKSLEELAAEQGVSPINNPQELRGDFWPEDESADDFMVWLRQLRRERRGDA